MKRLVGIIVGIVISILVVNSVLAAGFGISPYSIEIDVPSNGSTNVDFTVYDYIGDIDISLEDIPLEISPTSVHVPPGDSKITLTFYGDGSGETYSGSIRFLANSGSNILAGIKVKAEITVGREPFAGVEAEGGIGRDSTSVPGWLWLALALGGLALIYAGYLLRRRRRLIKRRERIQ